LSQGLISSTAEVIAVCGFVFGVACKLPPSLTILLLNGVFWVVIARHIFWDILYKRNNHRAADYSEINDENEGTCISFLKRKLVPLFEFFAFLMQLGALIAIPILLAYTENNYKSSSGNNSSKYTTLYILIPVTLTIISVVWSGWLQKYFVEPSSRRVAVTDELCIARLKSGEWWNVPE